MVIVNTRLFTHAYLILLDLDLTVRTNVGGIVVKVIISSLSKTNTFSMEPGVTTTFAVNCVMALSASRTFDNILCTNGTNKYTFLFLLIRAFGDRTIGSSLSTGS